MCPPHQSSLISPRGVYRGPGPSAFPVLIQVKALLHQGILHNLLCTLLRLGMPGLNVLRWGLVPCGQLLPAGCHTRSAPTAATAPVVPKATGAGATAPLTAVPVRHLLELHPGPGALGCIPFCVLEGLALPGVGEDGSGVTGV